jgi:hypothetical protein
MNDFEQTLLLLTSALILASTLVVVVWRYLRDRRKP